MTAQRNKRRTKAEINELKDAIYDILVGEHPMTVRQLFYRLVTLDMIEKTENDYKNVVVRLTGNMRKNGEMPYSFIADNTRWMRKPVSYTSVSDMLNESANCYRRALWENQNCYCEVWLEKEALSSVVFEVTRPWDVPLMVTRGYPSLSFLHGAADEIKDPTKPVYLFYLGDHDPSGRDISRFVEDGIKELAPKADVRFERLAINPEQIEDWDLPTRPTKKTDSRSRSFNGESVELDALRPGQIQDLVENALDRIFDPAQFADLQRAEDIERVMLRGLADEFGPN